MTLPQPVPSLVIRYNYLWADEAADGKIEGGKVRPSAVIVAATDDQGDVTVFAAPITHTPPTDPSFGIEIPVATRKRLGLDQEPCWVMTTELNKFAWPGPDLRPVSGTDGGQWAYGLLPGSFYEKIRAAILGHQRNGTGRIVRPS